MIALFLTLVSLGAILTSLNNIFRVMPSQFPTMARNACKIV